MYFTIPTQVCLHLSLTHSLQHFSGVIFQFVDSASTQSSTRRQRRARRVPLATGGRYDKLLSEFRRPGKQPLHPSVCVVGVSVLEEVVMSAVVSAYQAQQGQGSVSCISTVCTVCILTSKSQYSLPPANFSILTSILTSKSQYSLPVISFCNFSFSSSRLPLPPLRFPSPSAQYWCAGWATSPCRRSAWA